MVKTDSASDESENPYMLTLNDIKQNWQRIVDHIETPFIRMSFLDGEPIKFEKETLHLAFKSSTLMEKVTNIKNQSEIIKAIESVLRVKVILKPELKRINLKPISRAKDADNSPSLIEMAKEVFGA